MKKAVSNRQTMIMYHFSKTGKYITKSPVNDAGWGRIKRSINADVDDDWVIDMDAANCEVS